MNAYLHIIVYDLRLTELLITILPPTLIVFQERNKILYLFITLMRKRFIEHELYDSRQYLFFSIGRLIFQVLKDTFS